LVMCLPPMFKALGLIPRAENNNDNMRYENLYTWCSHRSVTCPYLRLHCLWSFSHFPSVSFSREPGHWSLLKNFYLTTLVHLAFHRPIYSFHQFLSKVHKYNRTRLWLPFYLFSVILCSNSKAEWSLGHPRSKKMQRLCPLVLKIFGYFPFP
jgi:hypothetical protein